MAITEKTRIEFDYGGKHYMVGSDGIFTKIDENYWDYADDLLRKLLLGNIRRVKPFIPDEGQKYFVPNIYRTDKFYDLLTYDFTKSSCRFHIENDLVCETREEAISLAKSMLEVAKLSQKELCETVVFDTGVEMVL